jgi:periplasmic copper chaperone A
MTRLRALVACVCVSLAALLVAAAAAMPAPLEITDAWSRATPPGLQVGVAYLAIVSHEPQADELQSVSSPLCERVEIHESRVVDGIMRMRPLASLAVPAGGRVVLGPNGTHLMLLELHRALAAGERLPLVLRFRHAGILRAEAVVRSLGAT